MNDSLSQRLQDWRPRTDYDPGFSAQVQNRLCRSSVPAFSAFFRYAVAASLIGAVTIGVGEGLRLNQAETSEQFATSYARSIDPLLLVEHHPAHFHP